MQKTIDKLKAMIAWLRSLFMLFAFLVCFASNASAQDIEFWKAQAKINQLLEQRIAYLEKRVALLEQKTPTAYAPGYTPPPVQYTPQYAPAYMPPYVVISPTYIPPLPDDYYKDHGGHLDR